MFISTFIKNQSIENLKFFINHTKLCSFGEIVLYVIVTLLGIITFTVGIRKIRLISLISTCLLYFFSLVKIFTLSDLNKYPEYLQNGIKKIILWSNNHKLIFWLIAGLIPFVFFLYFSLFRKKSLAILLSFFLTFSFVNFDLILYLIPSLENKAWAVYLIIISVFFILMNLYFFFGNIMFLLSFSSVGSFFTCLGLISFSLELVNTIDKKIYQRCKGSNLLDIGILIGFFVFIGLGIYLQISFRKNY